MVPKRIFLTNGVGKHREESHHGAGPQGCGNRGAKRSRVSSIFPPHCKLISRKEGVKYLHPGEVTFAVVADTRPREPHRLTAASIGLAMPGTAAPTATGASTIPLAKPMTLPANTLKSWPWKCSPPR